MTIESAADYAGMQEVGWVGRAIKTRRADARGNDDARARRHRRGSSATRRALCGRTRNIHGRQFPATFEIDS